jgi:hypothetical protein
LSLNCGDTLIVGRQLDNSGAGAAWVYTRNDSVWTEQAKLKQTSYGRIT